MFISITLVSCHFKSPHINPPKNAVIDTGGAKTCSFRHAKAVGVKVYEERPTVHSTKFDVRKVPPTDACDAASTRSPHPPPCPPQPPLLSPPPSLPPVSTFAILHFFAVESEHVSTAHGDLTAIHAPAHHHPQQPAQPK